MEKNNYLEKYKKEIAPRIINQNGTQCQVNKCIEELSELIRALARNDVANIKEEVADTTAMIEQIKLIFNIKDEEVHNIIEEKANNILAA